MDGKSPAEIARLTREVNAVFARAGVKQTIGGKQPTTASTPPPPVQEAPQPPPDQPPSAPAPPPESPNRAECRRTAREQPTDGVAAIAAALEILCEPHAWHELRTLNGNGRVTASGYFNNRESMAKEALRLNRAGNNVYFTLNAALPELAARSVNHTVDWPKHATADEHIVSRQWLLIDIDPKRGDKNISGISATDGEHEAALALAERIRLWLMEDRNWPAPIMMDSGNGAYLVFRVVLPNDDAAKQLVTDVLQVLAERFKDDRATIDTSTYNSSRIARVPGTVNRKGDSTSERPHRTAGLLDIPEELTPVSREQLEQVASEHAAPADSEAPPPTSASPELQAVLTALEQRGITTKEPSPYKDGLKFILSACLFNAAHGGTSVVIIEYGSGAKQYICKHSECKDKKWGDLLRALQPEAPPTTKQPAGQSLNVNISRLPDVRKMAAEKVEFLVPGLLVKGAITLFSGPPGSGKTTLLLFLADAVARGGEILGGTCTKCKVLYVTKEMPLQFAADIARRFRIDNGEGENLVMWGPWNEQSPLGPVGASILEWVSKCESPPLIIFDQMVAFLPEGSSENDSVEMRKFFGLGRTLLQVGAAGVVYLHHTGKADTAQQYRGSSDIEAAIDAGYKVTNSGDCRLDRLLLKLFKPRFLEQKQELVLRYSENDGVATFISDERKDAPRITIATQLRNLLETMPACTTTEFQKAAMAKGVTQSKARNYLTAGVENGDITVEFGPHNAKYHRLANRALFTPDEGGTVQ